LRLREIYKVIVRDSEWMVKVLVAIWLFVDFASELPHQSHMGVHVGSEFEAARVSWQRLKNEV